LFDTYTKSKNALCWTARYSVTVVVENYASTYCAKSYRLPN